MHCLYVIVLLFSVLGHYESLYCKDNDKIFYAMLMADASETGFGESLNDVNKMNNLFRDIAQKIGYTYRSTCFYNEQISPENIESCLHKFPQGKQNIVAVYCSTHGINQNKGDRWPAIIIPRKAGFGITGGSIVRYLQKSTKKLAFVFFDSCNKNKSCYHFDVKGDLNPSKNSVLQKNTPIPLKVAQALFLHCSGMVIASAAEPDQVSFIMETDYSGSMFTEHFCRALQAVSSLPRITWNEVLTRAKLTCVEEIKAKKAEELKKRGGKSFPQFQIQVNEQKAKI